MSGFSGKWARTDVRMEVNTKVHRPRPKIQTYVTSISDPKEAWDTLEKQFSFVSITQLVRVYRNFYASSMSEGGNAMEHITKMTQLSQDLREIGKEIESKEFAVVVVLLLLLFWCRYQG